MLALTAYLDESGTHDDARVITVAGYISTPEQWAAFELEWRTALVEFGLLPGQPFHMTDCMSGKVAPYDKWTDQDKRFRIARLIAITNRHTLATFGVALQRKMFSETLPRDVKKFIGGPYGMAASICFLEGARVLKDKYPSARVAYVFESGAKGSGEVHKVFNWNYKRPTNRGDLKLLSLAFEDKALMVPLQAADILAHQLCLNCVGQFGFGSVDPRVTANVNLLSECRSRNWITLDQEGMSMHAAVGQRAVAYHGAKPKKSRRKRRAGRPARGAR